MAEYKAKYQVKCLVTNGKWANETFSHAAASYDRDATGVTIKDTEGVTFFYPVHRLVRVAVADETGGK